MKKELLITTILFTATVSLAFDLDSISKKISNNIPTTTNGSKQDDTISKGLKEALNTGINFAIKELGSQDGYLDNSLVKIPLPKNLSKVETVIRKAGGDRVVDNLILSMNNAATQAAPQTASILLKAVNDLTLTDAQKILSGDNNAATTYFKENTTESLKKLITPIIQKSMDQNQVSKYYKTVNEFYKSNISTYVDNSSTMQFAKNIGVDSYIPTNSDQNVDDYVTDKAISGLFKMIAEKEAAIRKNPLEQTTSILKQVFGK
ncbi:MAG: DUF4197 domain-containing protein [Arcobacteraceae bacterium]